MNRHEFNRDLGEYINQKKGTGNKSLFYFFSKPTTHALQKRALAQTPPQHLEKEEKELETMEAKIEEINDIEHTVEDKREGLLQGFFKKLRIFNKQQDDHVIDMDGAEEEEEAPINEDVKHVLKMTYAWLDYLPEEKVLAFKRSEDFEIYKRVLVQHGLIKQPPAQAPAEEEAEEDAKQASKQDDF